MNTTTKINYRKKLNLYLVSAVAGLSLISCLDNGNSPEIEDDYIQVISSSTHGDVLADEEGNVLYFFTRDVKGESRCEGNCIENWPVFLTQQVIPGGSLDGEDLEVVTRPDGTDQLAYKGWPLYYFAGDEQPGEVNGDGANDVWYAAKTSYSLMIADEQLTGADGVDYTGDYEEGEEVTSFFTDAEGRTIYRFVNDERNTNNFTDEDFSNDSVWPIFHVDIDELPSGMDEADFGEIMVHGTEPQLTYRGWPLYYFGQDEERGDTKGVSFPQPGFWPIVNTDTPEAQ